MQTEAYISQKPMTSAHTEKGKEQTMSRYIDADALHKAYIELRNFKQDTQTGDWISLRAVPLTTVIRILNDAPSIDIVRCKECKFSARYVDDGHIECRLYSHPLRHDYHEMKPDDFCSYGEREGE